MAKNWTSDEIAVLKENIGKKMTPAQVAEQLGKSEMAVRLFCTRHQINIRQPLERPMLTLLLRVKFGEPEYFRPAREFFRRVCISQKRFSALRQGYVQPTEAELRAVCRELKMNHAEYAEFFYQRQLSLFDDMPSDTGSEALGAVLNH